MTNDKHEDLGLIWQKLIEHADPGQGEKIGTFLLKAFEPALKQILHKINDSNNQTESLVSIVLILYAVMYEHFPDIQETIKDIMENPPEPTPGSHTNHYFNLIKRVQNIIQYIDSPPSTPAQKQDPIWLRGVFDGGLEHE